MEREELERRFREIEAELDRVSERARQLREQGLLELADRENQNWQRLGEECVRIGDQLDAVQRQEPVPLSSPPQEVADCLEQLRKWGCL